MGPGGMEDSTVPFITEYGGSDGQNECAYERVSQRCKARKFWVYTASLPVQVSRLVRAEN